MSRGVYSTSNYFSVASGPSNSLPMTLAVWVYPTSDSATDVHALCVSADTNNDMISMGIEQNIAGNPAYVMHRGAGSTIREIFVGSVLQDQWSHICAVINSASSRKLYLNGTPSAENTDATGALATLVRTSLGIRKLLAYAKPFPGYVAHAAIWSGIALTDGEIKFLANGGNPLELHSANLVRYWKVNEATGNLADSSGNGITLPQVGTVADGGTNPVVPAPVNTGDIFTVL